MSTPASSSIASTSLLPSGTSTAPTPSTSTRGIPSPFFSSIPRSSTGRVPRRIDRAVCPSHFCGPFTVLPGTVYNSPHYSEQRVGPRTASSTHLLSLSIPQLPYEDGVLVQPPSL